MKNLKPILTALVVMINSNASAQRAAKTYLDLMVNVTSTNFHYGGSNDELAGFKKNDKGIQAGASFQGGITPAFSLVTALYYMRKGGQLITGNPLSGVETTIRLNTIEMPVLARLHLGKVYVNAGPFISYAVSGKQKIDNQSEKLSFEHSSDGFRRFDAGLQGGGGFEFPIKQKRMALDIRYNYGLTNISRRAEMYSRGIMVSVYFSKAWKSNPLAGK